MAKETQARAAEAGALTGTDRFSDILKQTIKPRTDIAAKEVDNAVIALVREALDDESLIAEDVIDTHRRDAVEKQGQADRATERGHPQRRIPEAGIVLARSWPIRWCSETDASLRVKVMNVSKKSCNSRCGAIRARNGTSRR